MTAYREKPRTVQVIQWTGKNFKEIQEFIAGLNVPTFAVQGQMRRDNPAPDECLSIARQPSIPAWCRPQDWIVFSKPRTIECFPPELFAKNYEEVGT